MISIGGIVSVGGTGGGSGGGSTSGVQEINGQTGPNITINGNDGIGVTSAGNTITIDGASLSGTIFAVSGQLQANIDAGGGGADGSGVHDINGAVGPLVVLDGVNGASILTDGNTLTVDVATLSGIIPTHSGVIGVNGITVEQVGGNFVVDGSSISGVSFSATFTSVTSTTIAHNLGTNNVVTSVYDSADNQMFPDSLNVVDVNNILLGFNVPQTGKIVIAACGGNDNNFEECRRYALLVS